MPKREIPDDVSEPLRDYFEAKRGIPKTSFKNQLSVARRFEDWLQAERDGDTILDAEPRDVIGWLREFVHDGYAGSTVHQYHTDLRTIYNAWTDDDGDGPTVLAYQLDQNPANFELNQYIKVGRTAEKQNQADNNEGVFYLDPSEVRKLRANVTKPEVRNELIIKILVQTGLRRGELSQLRIDGQEDHLDREREVVVITEETSKTDTGRTVKYDDLDPELTMWLDGGYRDRQPDADDSPYLLINRQSPQLSPSRISSVVREAADNAGLDDGYMENSRGDRRRRVTAHTLRATFIMRLLDAGIPTPQVMELSGHENLETVEKYANVLDDDALDAYEQADIEFGT